MLFFLYWSVSLFCILNLSAPSNPISNVYSGLTWGKVEGVRVLSEGWSVTKTRCYGINWITFPLTVLFSSSFQRSHLIMTFSSVLYLFFVCHAGTATLMCACVYTHTFSLWVLIARVSARKPSVWGCCGRQRKQRCGYSNEHPIMPAKSHFCVAHAGAKLHSFDLKPLLTQLRRWVISPRRLTGAWDNTSSGLCLLFLFLYLSWSFSQYLAFIKGVERDKRGRLQITDNDAGLMKRMEKFH